MNSKSTAKRRSPPRPRHARAMLTVAIMTGAGDALPKGAARLTFKAPSDAVEALAVQPAKVRPLLQSYGEALASSRKAGRPVTHLRHSNLLIH